MAISKTAQLVARLLYRTEEGEVKWEETETEGVYQVAFPEYSIRVYSRSYSNEDGNGEPYFGLAIFNDHGSLVEEVWDPTLDNEFTYHVLRKLYEGARRKAMGVEQALDNLLNAF